MVGVVVCWVLLRAARSGPELAVPATLTALTLGAAYTLSGYVAWALPAAALRHRSLVARLAAYQAVVLVTTYEIVRRPIPGALGADLVQLAMFVGPAAVLALLVVLVVHVGRPSVDDALPVLGRASRRDGHGARAQDEWTVSNSLISDCGIRGRPSATRRVFISLISVRCTFAMVPRERAHAGVLAVLGRVLGHRDPPGVVADHEVREQVVGIEARRFGEVGQLGSASACPACRPGAPGGPSRPSPRNRRR